MPKGVGLGEGVTWYGKHNSEPYRFIRTPGDIYIVKSGIVKLSPFYL